MCTADYQNDWSLLWTYNYEKVSDIEQNPWKEKSLNDLYLHLIEISTRRQNILIVGDRSIQSMIKTINECRSMISIFTEENLAYTALLKVKKMPGVPDSMYNEIMNHVSNLWTLNSEKVNLLVIPSHQERFFLIEIQSLYMERINFLQIDNLSNNISNCRAEER